MFKYFHIHFEFPSEPGIDCYVLRILFPLAEIVDSIIHLLTFTSVQTNLAMCLISELTIRRQSYRR